MKIVNVVVAFQIGCNLTLTYDYIDLKLAFDKITAQQAQFNKDFIETETMYNMHFDSLDHEVQLLENSPNLQMQPQ